MFPHERSLVKNLAGKPFAIIGVNSDSSISIPQRLAKEGTVTWRSFQNGPKGDDISTAFGVRGWPTIYLIDAKGVVRFVNPQREGKLEEAIAELLEELGEEYPKDQIEADTKAEKGKSAVSAPSGNDGVEGEGTVEERLKKFREQRAKKRPAWMDERPEDDEGGL